MVICKEFLNLIEGDIKVESAENIGTKFTFHFYVEPTLSNFLGKKQSANKEHQNTTLENMNDQFNKTNKTLVEQRKKNTRYFLLKIIE